VSDTLRQAAPVPAAAPVDPVEKEPTNWYETVKAKYTPAELADIRARAERYADESDDIEYFAGKTKAQQMKELEAEQRAEIEERVRTMLGGPPKSTAEGVQKSVENLTLRNDFDLGLGPEDDLCNFMSPSKSMMGHDLDDDDDFLRPPSPGTALAFLDDELAALSSKHFSTDGPYN
jgi:hypothetical protein